MQTGCVYLIGAGLGDPELITSIAEDGGDVKNRAIALQVGVGFPIGK